MKSHGLPHVILAPVSLTRKDEFLKLTRQSRAFHKNWIQVPATGEKFQEFVRRTRRKSSKSFFVLESGSRRLAGVVNISNIVRGFFQSAFLGYYVFEPFANKGYMQEALQAVLTEAFNKLGLHRLEANIQPANKYSKRLVQSLGFRLEGFSPGYLQVQGTWRDHERWALTKEDWSKHANGKGKRSQNIPMTLIKKVGSGPKIESKI